MANNSMRSKTRNGKKKKRALKIWMAVFIFLLALLAVGLIAVGIWLPSKLKHTEIDKTPEALGINETYNNKKYDDVVNVALFGVDTRGGERGRSDTVMILSIDRKRNKVKVISLMRDSYVSVEGHGHTKLCHAYSYGGAPLAIKTVNQNYDLNIKDYVMVNFDSLAQVIDAVGGVTIDISEAERKNANISIKEYAAAYHKTATLIQKSGEQVLNGMQAVGYARIRHVGNDDYERTERQRRVLEQVFNKALKMNPLEYPKMLSTILPLVETSLEADDILGIGISVMKSGSAKFEQARFPLNEDIVVDKIDDGLSCVVSDLSVTSEKLKKFIFDDINPTKSSANSTSSSN